MSENEQVTVTRHKTVLTTTNPFEQNFGYHRAVRRGPFIMVSGTTALKLLQSSSSKPQAGAAATGSVTDSESKVYFPGDAYRQTIHILEVCLAAVTRLGGSIKDVVWVRMFVASNDICGTVGEAFSTVFGGRSPGSTVSPEQDDDIVGTAATMIVVPGGFVDGDILVEIEVEAFVI